MDAARNSACPMGTRKKTATNRLTQQSVTSAPASTTARTARRSPSRSVMKPAMADTQPLSSMSLPNRAPSRNNGKNCARKVAAPPMKVWVQLASSGSSANAAASRAAAGARRSTLQPRSASQISSANPSRIPMRPMVSYALEQLVEVKGGSSAQIVVMGAQERVTGAAPLVAQHAQELPLGVELRRVTELYHHVAGDAVDAHVRPFGALRIIRLCNLAQQGDHAQLFQQHGIERDLVEPVENVAGRARQALPFDRVDLNENRILGAAFPHQRRDGGIARIAAVPIAFAIDLDGLEQRGEARRREQNVRRDLAVSEDAAASGANVRRGDEKFGRRLRQPTEIDGLGKNVTQGVCTAWTEIVGRKQARHQVHRDEDGRMVERPTTQQHVERSTPQWAQQGSPGYAAPKIFQRGTRPVDAIVGIAVDQHRRIHRPRRGAGDTIDAQPRLLK